MSFEILINCRFGWNFHLAADWTQQKIDFESTFGHSLRMFDSMNLIVTFFGSLLKYLKNHLIFFLVFYSHTVWSRRRKREAFKISDTAGNWKFRIVRLTLAIHHIRSIYWNWKSNWKWPDTNSIEHNHCHLQNKSENNGKGHCSWAEFSDWTVQEHEISRKVKSRPIRIRKREIAKQEHIEQKSRLIKSTCEKERYHFNRQEETIVIKTKLSDNQIV